MLHLLLSGLGFAFLPQQDGATRIYLLSKDQLIDKIKSLRHFVDHGYPLKVENHPLPSYLIRLNGSRLEWIQQVCYIRYPNQR